MIDDIEFRAFEPVLRNVRDNSEQYFGRRILHVQPVQVKEGPASTVLRAKVISDGPAIYLYIKKVKPKSKTPSWVKEARESVEREFSLTSIISSTLEASGFSVVQPIACLPADLSIVSREVSGQTLRRLLVSGVFRQASRKHMAYIIQAFEHIGEWIRAFQKVRQTDRKLDVEAIWSSINETLAKCSYTDAERTALRRHLDLRCAEVEAQKLLQVNVHGDLCPPNIIVDGLKVTVLDFANVTTGSDCYDIVNLYIHINTAPIKPFMLFGTVADFREALFNGFGRKLDIREPLFELTLFQHILEYRASLELQEISNVGKLYSRYIWKEYVNWIHEIIQSHCGSRVIA